MTGLVIVGHFLNCNEPAPALTVVFLMLLFLAKIIITLAGLIHAIGFNLKSWRPYLILMPIFTPYVHSCFINMRRPRSKIDPHLTISPLFTVLNIVFNIFSNVYLACHFEFSTFD